MPWTVYCHIHINSSRRYIGLTSKTMERRWSQHVCQARNSKGGRWHFPNAIRKYGKDAFSHEVLEVCDTLEEANMAEEKWVEHFDTRNPERGFNITKGGEHAPHPKKNPWDRPEYRTLQGEMPWTIYCHTHINSGCRYIGLTKKTMLQRWNQHIYMSNRFKRGYGHFPNAIRKYGKDAFSHEVLEVCNSLEEANVAEERWIELYNTRNPDKGFNLAKGGEHIPHPIRKNPWDDPEFRSRNLQRFISAGQTQQARAANKAALNTPESREKRSAAARASLAKPETVAKREIMRADPAYGRRISESLKASLASEEARVRMSEASRTSATPEVCEKRSNSLKKIMSKLETREKLSASLKAAWANPKYREKQISRVASPETRAKISRASTGKKHSSDSIQKQRRLYLERSSFCKFCDIFLGDKKRTCIKGRVSCHKCKALYDRKLASFLRPDGSFL